MLIAIRGYIGTGKTTIANYLQKKYNYQVFNCDQYVNYLYQNDLEIISQINKLLNHEANNPINKAELKEKIYQNEKFLRELEKVLYIKIEKKIKKIYNNNEVLFLDCPTIDKLAIEYHLDLWVISEQKQIINRVITRDQKTPIEIKYFLDQQKKIIPFEKSYQIMNDGDITKLYQQIDEFIAKELLQ